MLHWISSSGGWWLCKKLREGYSNELQWLRIEDFRLLPSRDRKTHSGQIDFEPKKDRRGGYLMLVTGACLKSSWMSLDLPNFVYNAESGKKELMKI